MRRRFRGVSASVGALLLALLTVTAVQAGLARGAETPSATVTVTIDNFSFTPKEITVAKGATVTWVNHDDVPHTVVNADEAFRSKALDTDDQFSFTFNDAGTFSYFCSVHPMMTGKVVVK